MPKQQTVNHAKIVHVNFSPKITHSSIDWSCNAIMHGQLTILIVSDGHNPHLAPHTSKQNKY